MLYHSTLHQATSVSLCAQGSYTSSERHSEFVLLRGSRILELWVHDPRNRKVWCVSKQELYKGIMQMKPLRPPGAERDYLIASSFEGDIYIFIYDFRKRLFIEVYYNSYEVQRSSKRVGHFIATDPRGRAFVLCAQENIKIVHSVRIIDQNNLDVSVIPFVDTDQLLQGVIYDIVFLYNTPDNDIVSFATTEKVYKDTVPEAEVNRDAEHFEKITENQSIHFFDVNLKRKEVRETRRHILKHTSNFLMEVPVGIGPGGVLMFSTNWVGYTTYNANDNCFVKCRIPRRCSDDDIPSILKPLIFTNCTLYMNRDSFYYLAQTELGDIFRISLTKSKGTIELQMQYYCSLPIGSALCILEPHYLFVAHDYGNHVLYIMEDFSLNMECVFSSCVSLTEDQPFLWTTEVRELQIIQEIHSHCPMYSLPFLEPCSLFGVSGCAGGFTLSGILQRTQIDSKSEIAVEEVVLQQNVIPTPNLRYLWSSLHTFQLDNRDFIVLSSDGKSILFEVIDQCLWHAAVPFISTFHTLAIKVLQNQTVVQITSQGLHTNKAGLEWKVPGNTYVQACALNHVQALLYLHNNTLHYAIFGEHSQMAVVPATIRNATIAGAQSILLSNDTSHADFACIATLNHSLFVVSLRPDTMFQCVYTVSNLSHPITSLLTCRIGLQEPGKLKLLIGLSNGALLVTFMNKITGELGKMEKYYLGPQAIKLFDCGEMVLILSDHIWLYLQHDNQLIFKRVYYASIDTACNLKGPNKFVVFSKPILRLVCVKDLDAGLEFNRLLDLPFNPQKVVSHPMTNMLFLTIPILKNDPCEHHQLYRRVPVMEKNITSSLLFAFYPFTPIQQFSAELGDRIVYSFAFANDTVMFMGSRIAVFRGDFFLQMLKLNLLQCQIHANELDKVKLDDAPNVIETFGAGVLVGVGKNLVLYTCNSVLKIQEECKWQGAPTSIVGIDVNDHNILLRDSQAGFVLLKYNKTLNKLQFFAQDRKPVSDCCFFGPDSIAKTDENGNITILKYILLKERPLEEQLWDKLASKKSKKKQAITMIQLNVGECVVSMQMATLFMRGQPVLVYSTISGTLGAIAEVQDPSEVKYDEDFLSKLEKFMLRQDSPVCQDFINFRLLHTANEKIFNGDLFEQYRNLNPDEQDEFARFINKTSEEVIFKLVAIRSRFLF